MASIRPRTRKDGTTTFAVLFTIGARQTSVTWATMPEAERFRALVNTVGGQRALEIEEIADTVRKPAGVTVAEWLNQYVDHLTGVEPATANRYRAYIRNDIAPALGAIPLNSLAREDVARWVKGLAGSGKTIRNKHGLLAAALNAAVADGHIKSSPCNGNRLPRWQREEMTFLTREEYAILREALRPYWRPLVEFLVASGCRWSEATALKPSDVDRSEGTVRITRAWKHGNKLGAPKTRKSVRTINVPSSVLDQLDYTGEWLFTLSGKGNRGTDSPVRLPSFHGKVWTPALARAGLTKSPRIHDLRHTCASWMLQAGIPITVVQGHLGHESIQTTVDLYGHLDRSNFKAAAAAIGAALST
jgi:integrase